MDNLHFNFFHLFSAGFRTMTPSINNLNDYCQIVRKITDKRDKFDRFKTTTNKYNMNGTSSAMTEDKGETFCDLLFNEIENEAIINFIIEQQFDTESICDDFEDILFCPKTDVKKYGQSNFYQHFGSCKSSNIASRRFMKMLKLMQKYESYVFIHDE